MDGLNDVIAGVVYGLCLVAASCVWYLAIKGLMG
jgi:hypothetical protein